MLNRQLAFTHALTALRTQGKAAMSDMGGCVYIADDGSRCAVGHLIIQDKYDLRMEGGGICERPTVVDAIDPKFGVITTIADIEFLADMQSRIHDMPAGGPDAEFMQMMNENAVTFAKYYGLEMPC